MSYSIDDPPPSPNAANEEFAGALGGAWTVLAGTPGTVDLIGTTGGVYDLATLPGTLLCQPGNGSPIKIVRSLALADGESIVAKVRCCNVIPGTENSIDLGLTLTDSPTDYSGGSNFVTLHYDSEPNGGRVYMGDGVREGGFAANTQYGYLAGRPWLIRMLRQGGDFLPQWSPYPRHRGQFWHTGPMLTPASGELLYLHLYAVVTQSISGPLPIHGFDWVRVGGSGINPW